jgi:putative FmdB family regulatory protein
MPLYEYQCDKCGESFEAMQKFSDEPIALHEKCGGPVHRLLSAPALQFKGSGWYITDYAKNSGSKSNGSANKADSKDSKTSSSSEGATTGTGSETKSSSSSSSTDSK